MNSASFATSLLGATVRLLEPTIDAPGDSGEIVAMFIKDDGLHYVILIHDRLIEAIASQFRVIKP